MPISAIAGSTAASGLAKHSQHHRLHHLPRHGSLDSPLTLARHGSLDIPHNHEGHVNNNVEEGEPVEEPLLNAHNEVGHLYHAPKIPSIMLFKV